ncbi:MAG: hypothetical protein IPN05_08500 [Sulfuritalea sp.]|nr:hypothetical protein [Sulfuritalea sp.]
MITMSAPTHHTAGSPDPTAVHHCAAKRRDGSGASWLLLLAGECLADEDLPSKFSNQTTIREYPA